MLKPGMEMIASRFETRRYLALLGGTTEFTKWEGLTFAPDHGALYHLPSLGDATCYQRNIVHARQMYPQRDELCYQSV